MSGRPRDGPATAFEADTHVDTLVSLQQQPRDDSSKPDEFSLVLVAGWPPGDQIMCCYNEFLTLVRQCFDHEDVVGSDAAPLTDEFGAAYLYPPTCLHVTVATLHSMAHETHGNPEQRSLLTRHWTDVLLRASRRPEWPTEPLELVIDSAQIGTRAGILLWSEQTGGLDRMRSCIRQETKEHKTELEAAGINVDTLSIPGIVHSTFLRFYKVPETSGQVVQERFERLVLPRLRDVFSSPVVLNDAKLACERIPYMHIPNDKHHVFSTFPLRKEVNKSALQNDSDR